MFETEYKRLNKAQKGAVDTIEGPVMVVAGPGTGKTQILTLRIANILKQTDTDPDSILALTFTESGVQSMRKRLADMIRSAAYQVTISTFHSFANDIIKENPEEFPHIIGSKSITDIKQVGLIEEIISGAKDLDILKPFGDVLYYVRTVKGAISDLKREGISPHDFETIVAKKESEFAQIDDLYYESGAHEGKMRGKYKTLEKQIKKNKELALIYRRYQDLLQEKKLYDYDDMIIEVLRALRDNGDLLLRLQEVYQYILVDEHQDTNNAQNKILELLASYHAPRPNLFIVGDDKQSIFKFQGASLENFYYFKHLYPEAKLITLKENYRSSQTILDSAHSLLPGDAHLQAFQKFEERHIDVYAFSTEAVETYFIREDIKKKIDEGVSPHEIAILYRDNKDAFAMADMLERAHIPFRIESDQDIFTHDIIRKFLIILQAIEQYGDFKTCGDAMHIDVFGIEPLDTYKIIRKTKDLKKNTIYDLLHDEKKLEEIKIDNKEAVISFATAMTTWSRRYKNTDLVTFLEEVLTESGLLQQILKSPHAQEELDVIDVFFEEVKQVLMLDPNATLSDFFAYLDTLKEHNLYIKKKKIAGREGFVRLMTAHRSKGLEFEYVYIMHVHDKKWGGKKISKKLALLPEVHALYEHNQKIEEDDDNDERRLFYVALTRAKKHIVLTYAKENNEGKEQIPSRFIGEIDEKFISCIDSTDIEDTFAKERGKIMEEKRMRVGHSLKDQAFVRELFLKQGLSVTALNNYLICPWRYFYRNLIRLPEPEQPHLMYGTSVHSALEYLFKHLRRDDHISKEDFLSHFKTILKTQSLRDVDLERYLERGEKALSGWYETYQGRWITETRTELAIRGIKFSDTILLTGQIDKLEFLSEREVNVVDYKTGKTKTRNEILGKTKTSDGSLWRQIVFYKLLLDHYKDGMYEMVSAEIDFVEPQQNGSYRKEKFTVDQDDVDDLSQTITSTAEQILGLTFWDARCDDAECPYCKLRDLQEK